MDVAHHVEAVEREGAVLAVAAAASDLAAPVPACPGWTVRDLVRHIGGVHRWAATYVGQARTEVLDDDSNLERVAGGWPPDDELVEWYRRGHAALVGTLRSAPADLECVTFLPAPSPLALWARRQAHETTVHRIDAESAAGTLTPVPADLAADGIDELLGGFLPRPGSRWRCDPAQRVCVVATDVGVAWTVEVSPHRISTTRAVDAGADLTVRGPADALYRLLWNRAGPDGVEVAGDRALLSQWREAVRVRWS